MKQTEKFNTLKEIFQQPEMWQKEFDSILTHRKSIENFLSTNSVTNDTEIIMTGAGTSAYIGNVLTFVLPQNGYPNCKAIQTTDLITHPESFFCKDKKVLLVSFARSGNSPESLAAIEIADSIANQTLHIIITCNEQGALARKVKDENSLLLLLPPETNDVSLAMTSSFTTMLLSFLLLINIKKIESQATIIKQLCNSAKKLLIDYENLIATISKLDFKRAVFLGSGELKGIAEECHLKLQELTDGKVICKFDTFLGFRHGPKAVIDNETLLVYLFSSNEHIRKYEIDLVKQINLKNCVVAQIALSAGKTTKIEGVKYDLEVVMDITNESTKEYTCIPYVLIGQLLGFYKSLALGFDPDNPSVSGNISRVVEGVTIYKNNLITA